MYEKTLTAPTAPCRGSERKSNNSNCSTSKCSTDLSHLASTSEGSEVLLETEEAAPEGFLGRRRRPRLGGADPSPVTGVPPESTPWPEPFCRSERKT